jgi:hypothetical protein
MEASGQWRLRADTAGRVWTTSPRELGLRMRMEPGASRKGDCKTGEAMAFQAVITARVFTGKDTAEKA